MPDSAVSTAAATPSPANSLSAVPNINDEDVDLSSDSEEAEVERLVGSNDRPLSESFLTKLLTTFTNNSTAQQQQVRQVLDQLADAQKRGRSERGEDWPAPPEDEDPILIQESYDLKDDGNTVIDLAIRHRLATPNASPDTWWNKTTPTRHSKPRKGLNMYLDHISTAKVSALTIRRMSDRGAVITVRQLLPRNAGVEYADDGSKRLRLIAPSARNINMNLGFNWLAPKTVQEVVEGVHNYQCITYMYRYNTKSLTTNN